MTFRNGEFPLSIQLEHSVLPAWFLFLSISGNTGFLAVVVPHLQGFVGRLWVKICVLTGLFFHSHRTRECFGYKGTFELIHSLLLSCNPLHVELEQFQLTWDLSSKVVSPWLLMGKKHVGKVGAIRGFIQLLLNFWSCLGKQYLNQGVLLGK